MTTTDDLDDARVAASLGRILAAGEPYTGLPLLDPDTKLLPPAVVDALLEPIVDQKGAAEGIAELDADGHVPADQIPVQAIADDPILTGTIDAVVAASGAPIVRAREQRSAQQPSAITVVPKGAEFAWLTFPLLFDGVRFFTAFDVETLAVTGGTTYYVSDLGNGTASGTEVGTLTTPLEAGDAVTSIATTALSAGVTSAQRVALLVGTDVYFLTASATASSGATSIGVNSFTPTVRIPAGTKVVYPKQGLRTTIDGSSTGDTIVALDRVNYRERSTNPVDAAALAKTINIVGLHPETIYTTAQNLTWTLVGGTTRTYQASRTNVRDVVDISADWQGIGYTRVSTQAAVDTTPGSWYQATDGTGNVYVSSMFGSVPNSAWLFALFNNTHFNFTPSGADQTVMLKNLRLYGGFQGVRAISSTANKLTFIRKNTIALWGGQGAVGANAAGLYNGMAIVGNVDSYAQDSPVFHSCLDGTSYHASGTYKPRFFEERCGGHSAGTDQIPTVAGVSSTQNISTAHGGSVGIRVDQQGHHAYGTIFADVETGTVTENYSVDAYDSTAPDGDYNSAFSAQQSGAIVRTYGCRGWGTKYDLFAQVGATIVADRTQYDTVGGGGTKTITNPR